MRSKIREALTKTVWIQQGTRKKPKRLVVEPSERLVLGLYFAFLALILLTFLEATYIIILRSFNNEIFAAIYAICYLTGGSAVGLSFSVGNERVDVLSGAPPLRALQQEVERVLKRMRGATLKRI